MNAAYVDTSCLAAIAFGEPGSAELAERLASFDALLSSNLLEAELRASFACEEVPLEPAMLTWISWVLPARPLGHEIAQVLSTGSLRGMDVWHLACALYVVESAADLAFLTLDERQGTTARRLGFGA